MVNFAVYETVSPKIKKSFLEKARKIAENLLLEEGMEGEVDIAFMDDDNIRRLNKIYRGKDQPTDVLSFSYSNNAMVSQVTSVEPIGDIAISVETAEKNAAFYGNSLEKELCVLVIHGLLQVIGYSHETDDVEQQKIFEQKQIYYEGKLCLD